MRFLKSEGNCAGKLTQAIESVCEAAFLMAQFFALPDPDLKRRSSIYAG
jgi:hypothetical protein